MSTRLPHLTARLQGFPTTIFSEMTALALANDAVNLGQGYPDVEGPEQIREAAVEAMRAGHNQYAPGIGVGLLRQRIADHQRRFYDLDYDPDDEVTVTAGATEAITAAILSLCDVGDEVVCFEPYYDSHVGNVAMAGAVRRPVTLRRPDAAPPGGQGRADFWFDPADLDAAITPKTRLLVLNSPHNPSGKVFTRTELEQIAQRCVAHDLIAVTDEVYEHLVFEGEHIPLATLPGMRERTVTVSSGGKTFSFTGWKVGWLCAPAPLTAAVRIAKQFLSFTNGTPFQHAIAQALELPDSYYDDFVAGYRASRDRLCTGLDRLGLDVFWPAGTYFATADVRPLGYDDGMAFCRQAPGRIGVAAVPSVALYDDVEEGRPLVRFAFCKRDDTIDEALARLGKLAPAPDGDGGRTRPVDPPSGGIEPSTGGGVDGDGGRTR